MIVDRYITELLGRASGLLPLQLYRMTQPVSRSDQFIFRLAKPGETVYEYGPFNREATKGHLRTLDARIGGLAWVPAILDATLKGRIATIEVNASVLSTIWRTLDPSKKWQFAGRYSDGDMYLEEFQSIMTESTNLQIDDLAEELKSLGRDILESSPDLRMIESEEHIRDRVFAFLKQEGTKLSDGSDPVAYATDLVNIIMAQKSESKASTMIDMALGGADPVSLVESVQHNPGFFLGDRVVSKERMSVSYPDDEVQEQAEGLRGRLVEVTPSTASVLFDDGGYIQMPVGEMVTTFMAESEDFAKLAESVQLGQQYYGTNGVVWEVAALDFLTSMIIVQDPQDPNIRQLVDMDEFKSQMGSGRWSMI